MLTAAAFSVLLSGVLLARRHVIAAAVTVVASLLATAALSIRTRLGDQSDVRVSYSWAVYPAVMLLAIGLDSFAGPGSGNQPGNAMLLAWAAVAAASALVAAESTLWRSILLAMAGVAMVGIVFVAYGRTGGWPGVAGWEAEFGGISSPVVVGITTIPLLALAPLVGHALGRLCAVLPSTRTHRVAPAR